MENSQLDLATESFSYSWLLDQRPPFDGLVVKPPNASLADSVEISPKEVNHMDMVPSRRFLDEAQNFNFDIPVSESSGVLVHADEIFSDGYMMPVYLDRSKIQASTSAPATPISSFSSRVVSSNNKSQPNFLQKWRKSSNRILQKCSGLLRPICQRLRCSRKSIRVDDLGRKVWEVQSCSNSLQASPRRSIAYSSVDGAEMDRARGKLDVHDSLRTMKSGSNSPQASPLQSPSTAVLYDAECSIYEAILHCKRSIEK